MVKIFPKLKPVHSLHQVLVSNEDETNFSITHPKHLALYASPLANQRNKHHRTHEGALLKHPHHSVRETHGDETPPEKHEHRHNDHHEDDVEGEPVLKRAHESSTIQLFYDLFFVANLTTFTAVHEIDDSDTLKSYVGFFSILWFTWLQVAMFDVRFSNDSVWERFCKALQFGIMTGFAVVGPGYKTGWEPNTPAASTATNSFTTLTLILMTSRLILACQYLAVMISLRAYKKAWLPMLTHIGTMFVAAMIYLGLFFSFSKSGGENGLIAWYIVLGFEAIVIFLVSGKTKFLSFRRTAIVERLGLLTLIILGEGIIGMCGSIRKVGTDRVFNADVIGMIICSVGIIYFLWMLYFDQTETERVGTMRQQFWAILHFPFHVCILLLVEGLSRLSVWRKILDIVIPFENEFFAATDISDTEEMIKALNETLDHVFSKFDESEFVLPDPTPYFDVLRDANATKSTTLDAGYNLFALGFNFVSVNFGIKPSEKNLHKAEQPFEFVVGVADLFNTVFLYFFIAAGFTLIILAGLFWIGKRRKLRGEILSVFVRIFAGIGLALLALMALPALQSADFESSFDKYIYSPWMLPTVLLTYGVVVFLDNVLINYVHKVIIHRTESDV